MSRAIAMHCLLMHFTIQVKKNQICFKIVMPEKRSRRSDFTADFIVMENFLWEKKTKKRKKVAQQQ